jgi:peptidyl-prolyl cis-trans isomerase SurA
VDEDLRDAYRRLVLEERQRLTVTPAWIVIGAGATPSDQRKQRALASSIAEQAQSSDFAELARRHSEDVGTRHAGGLLAKTAPSDLPGPLARTSLGLEVGQSSAPVRVGDRYVVLKVVARQASELPDFEQARQELAERVYGEKMAQAKKVWLDGLRRQHHVEVRL